MSRKPDDRNRWPLLLLLLLITAFGAAPAPAAPASLAAAIDRYAAAHDFSGTILVGREGRILYGRSFGLADRAFAVPARGDTRYRIASVTKLFTAALVLQLVDEGKIDLAAPVARYLPDYPGEGGDRIAIRQLLNHTSGLAQYDRIASLDQALTEGIEQYQRPRTAAALLKRCCSGPLAHPPGTVFDYNNADYLLLGRIVERIAGRPFEQVLEERILRPLGLRDTAMARQARIVPRLAPTYYWRGPAQGWMNDLPVYFENWDSAGGMYSTAADLLHFADALFGGRLVSAGALAAMLRPGLDDYGLGLWSYSFTAGGRAHRVAKRPGSIMGANAQLYRLIDERTTVVILANTNRADLDDFVQKIGLRLVSGPRSP
jgi:D-alanyl-D-alanine carboxypeptidase